MKGRVRYKVVGIIFAVFLLFFVAAKSLYDYQISKIMMSELSQNQRFIDESLDSLIAQKRNMIEALAITFSRDISLQSMLEKGAINNRWQNKIKQLTRELAKKTVYKHIWIQVLDKNGISLSRSWSNKHGDDLSKTRKDVASILQNPRSLSVFSVGKFALSFKYIVPVKDDQGKLIGLVDVIGHLNSIDKALYKSVGVSSVILALPKFKKQLVNAPQDRFLEDAFIANTDVLPEEKALIKKIGLSHIFSMDGFEVVDGQFVLVKPLLDLRGNEMAVWVALKPMDAFSLKDAHTFKNIYILVVIFIFLLLVFTFIVIYMRYQVALEKKFFYQFFNEATEVICIIDNYKIINANKAFYKLFDDVKNMDQFYKKYDCLLDFLTPESTDLMKEKNAAYWVDSLLQKAKPEMFTLNTTHGDALFSVKATSIKSYFGGMYTVLFMNDVTAEVKYAKQLEELVDRDELTGCYNRHYFNQELDASLNRVQRYQQSISLIMFDIDFFKKVNDEFGHDIGDKTLIDTTKLVQAQLRDSDRLCRIGGEEFIILLPETDLDGAILLADRIRVVIEESVLPYLKRSITISSGITLMTQWDNSQTVYKRVDTALYRAKDKGRNRVEVAE